MRTALAISLLLVGCSQRENLDRRPNRACILAMNALKQAHKEGSCESQSLGETEDTAIWRFDDGEMFCRDAVGAKEPLPCNMLVPTKAALEADAKSRAEAEAKAKIESDAKAKVEAETKARAEAAAGSGSAKGAPKP